MPKSSNPAKIEKVIKEFKNNELHSGSKAGPKVTSRAQGIAIALSEAKKGGATMNFRKKG